MKQIRVAILLLFTCLTAGKLYAQNTSNGSEQTQDSIPRLTTKDRINTMRNRNHIQLPMFSYNVYDGFQLGGVFTNYLSNQSGFKYTIAPMYGFASKRLVGSASFSYNIVKDSDAPYQRLRLGLTGRSYSFDRDTTYDTRDQFYKIAPEIALFKDVEKEETTIRHRLSYRFINIWQRYTLGVDITTLEFNRVARNYYINELRYEQSNMHEFNPSQTVLSIHQGNNFVKFFGFRENQFEYQEKRKVRLRMSFTYLPIDDTNFEDANVSLVPNGRLGSSIFQYDYTHDQNLIGRNESTGLWARQTYKKGAGINSNVFTNSPDKWLIGLGGDVDLPLPLRLNVYFDAALYKPSEESLTVSFSGGLSIPVIGDYFQIYIPFLNSSDIKDQYDFRDYSFWERITFSLRLKNLDRLVDKYYN